MTKPRFGIDIDGTVTCPATLIPHINKEYKVNITLDDVIEYDFLSAFPYPIDRNQFNHWFKENEPSMYAASELASNAKSILTDWQNRYELYYISARGMNVMDVTQNWFLQQGIPYDHIELIGSHDKISVAKKHEVQAFFEDKHDNAVMIAEELNIPVVLFNTPYNQLPVPTNVVRVNNWLEANDWILKKF
ncbi:5' nucleotidase, NT5C type [Lysinibacillus sp. 54212]|uniref:5' nucleotidase, NT5C type n=1 Tax=Lysinibacillus sp. 54212 TaxID=3119829 RepID=UPI002FCAFB78